MEGNGTCLGLSNVGLQQLINVPNQVEYQGDNDIDGDNFHHMDISYGNNQQAVPIETESDIPVDNGQIPNVVATRKSCRVRRIPRRLIE